MQAIEPKYQQMRAAIQAKGGTSTEEGLLTFYKDSTSPIYMQKDWKLVQYLLQEILNTEEKQLDGIYNLPSGASFFVPFQAWAMTVKSAIDELVNALNEFELSTGNPEYSEKVSENLEEKLYGGVAPNLSRVNTKNTWGNWRMSESFGEFGSELATTPPSTEETAAESLTEPAITFESASQMFVSAVLMFETAVFKLLGEPVPNTQVADTAHADRYDLMSTENTTAASTPLTTTEIPDISLTFNLNLNTRTQLVVDGRTLADIVKQYLTSDVEVNEGTSGSTTRSYTFI
jgi:hypothetical protein